MNRSLGRRGLALLAAAAMALLAGCAAGPSPGEGPATDGSAGAEENAAADGAYAAPAPGAFDYQLGGAYEPPAGTGIVVRDRTAAPLQGGYSVCYVNGFQTQPGEEGRWRDLLLTDAAGDPVRDPDWPDELLLDTSTGERREAIAVLLGEQLEGCALDGFDAVEFDNLDSFLRSEGLLEPADNLSLAEQLVDAAHGLGLAAAQKNAAELAAAGAGAGFDFAIVEECGEYGECQAFLDAYPVVLDVEYVDGDRFAELCASGALPPNAIRRDLALEPAGSPGHVFERCEA
ncbi:endo alpha-1,4 polygalactosaminidase [Gulosibacter sp. 10]|uniref:endo alpha-1,4 polygalactosaminidase n=1 Tax=Gulosibacter sp. 10 TaxID=1255570 RepID=UPI00097ECD77|nr:endo alpha-1,4 polygalactosaminidase [Gulosibacter sp. 10]SJM62066.1 DNA for SgaA, complete cds [Gulosibacter sp. 10]